MTCCYNLQLTSRNPHTAFSLRIWILMQFISMYVHTCIKMPNANTFNVLHTYILRYNPCHAVTIFNFEIYCLLPQDKVLMIPSGLYTHHFHSPCEDLESDIPSVTFRNLEPILRHRSRSSLAIYVEGECINKNGQFPF
jgi:hypothetical protein